MPIWHEKKYDKYSPLCAAIKSNGWSVDLFAVEVGARGYCSETVRSCLRRLGLTNKLCRSALKSLSTTSMKCSFYIWLSRDTKDWSLENENSSFVATERPPSTKPRPLFKDLTRNSQKQDSATESSAKPPQQDKENSKPIRYHNKGLLNKGNTCYVNAILQCLNVLPQFWTALASVSTCKSTLGSSCSKLFQQLSSAKVSVDPSPFLRDLKTTITKAGRKNFDIFSQQDAPEILEYILAELSVDSVFLNNLFQIRVQVSVTCNICHQSQITEETMPILQLSPVSSIQRSLDNFLETEELSKQNSYFCLSCNSEQSATLEREVLSCGQYMIIQLKRFLVDNDKVTKNELVLNCYPNSLFVPVRADVEVVYRRGFRLKSVINHYGTLDKGHYTSDVQSQSNWFHCNDKAVAVADPTSVNSSMSYVLFF